MFKAIKALFEKEKEESGISQSAREGIVDLLVWTMFIDKHISNDEVEEIRRQGRSLKWEGVRAIDIFIDGSIKRVRDILDCESAEKAYLQDIQSRLDSEEAIEKALESVERLIGVDGDRSDKELTHLKWVKESLTS